MKPRKVVVTLEIHTAYGLKVLKSRERWQAAFINEYAEGNVHSEMDLMTKGVIQVSANVVKPIEFKSSLPADGC